MSGHITCMGYGLFIECKTCYSNLLTYPSFPFTYSFVSQTCDQSRYSAASEIPTGYLLVMHWTDEEMSGMEEKVIAITDS